MPVQTRSKARSLKRNRESLNNDDNHNNSNNDESKQEEPPQKKRKISLSTQLMDLSEYICCICMDFPSNQIYQCSKGCLVCSDCHPKIIDSKCPLCRIYIDLDDPIRCRFAEKALAKRVVQCNNDGCDRHMIFSKLKVHEKSQCNKRAAICKFDILGCGWKGIEEDREQHENNCKLDQNETLKVVQNYQNTMQKHESEKDKQIHFTKMMNEMFIEADETFHFDICDGAFSTIFLNLETSKHQFEYIASKCYFEFNSKREEKDGEEKYVWSTRLCYQDDEDSAIYERDYSFAVLVSPYNGSESVATGATTGILISRMQERLVAENQSKGEWIAFDNSLPCDAHQQLFENGFKIMILT